MNDKKNKKDDEIKRLKEHIKELEKTETEHKQEIERRRLAEEKLIFEQKQFLSIFGSIEEVIYITDPDTYELIYFNKAFESRWKGKRGEEVNH